MQGAASEGNLAHGWRWDRGRLAVYQYTGGQRVVALLEVTPDRAALLVNARLLDEQARQVALGWALALASAAEPGWYTLLRQT